VRWSDTGDPTEWSAGVAGWVDLWDETEPIMCGEMMGENLVIYRENSIYAVRYAGTATSLFLFDRVVSEVGVVSSNGVVGVGDTHIFISEDNIYKYQGGLDVTPVGDRIKDMVLGTNGSATPGYLHRSFGFLLSNSDEVVFVIPTDGSTEPSTAIRASVDDWAWVSRIFYHNMIGCGIAPSSADVTWADLVGSWADQTWSWAESRLRINADQVLLCGYSPAQVYSYDGVSTDDAGNSLEWKFVTKDFSSPSNKTRFDMFEVFCKGTSVTLEYATDAGSTYKAVGSATLSPLFQNVRFWFQTVARNITFRLSGTGGGFALRWFGFRYKDESMN